MSYEIGRALRHLLDVPTERVGPRLRAAVEAGLTIRPDRYLDERAEMARLRTLFYAAHAEIEVFLWPTALGMDGTDRKTKAPALGALTARGARKSSSPSPLFDGTSCREGISMRQALA